MPTARLPPCNTSLSFEHSVLMYYELTDQEIAEQEEAFTHSRSLTEKEWLILSADSSLIGTLLSAISTHGVDAVDSFFEWLAEKHELKPE